MDYKDYYSLLGVDKSATKAEIKKAYRNLAKKYHPDKTNGDSKLEEKFKEVSEAYEVLSNDENRKKYDELGANWKNQQQAGGSGGFDYSQYYANTGGQGAHQSFEGDPEMFSEFFNNIFGGGYARSSERRQTVRKGQNYEAEMKMTLEEAFHGGTRIINVNGKKLRFKTKPGSKDKQKIKLPGKGSLGINGGTPGDLYITIRVLPNPNFKRKGDNLYSEIPLDMYTAVLGGKVEIPTLNGNVNMTIPKGTQGGKTLRLKGKGMPVYGSALKYGDLYVKTNITIPVNLSNEEEKLFIKLKEINHESNN
ncbi:MAG: J domain-containing protein [Bacteroidetes bacterium]|nr:J domain-containing protein [Bacteroidota bacterium]MBL6943402.1 J domain-containing protein [Bacteroidales bacterium]